MRRQIVVLAAASCMLAASPLLAASPNVEAAIKTLTKIEADKGKFATFCRIHSEMETVPENDTAKAEALDKQLEDLLVSIGQDVMDAWETGIELDPATDDGKAFDAALDALFDKCS
jgi:hypothetical protein